MNALDDWDAALSMHDHLGQPAQPPHSQRHVPEDRNDGATLIMGLYNVWCGECQSKITDRMPDEDIACPDCGAEFYFIRPSDERLLPEDHRAIEAVANATGLRLTT